MEYSNDLVNDMITNPDKARKVYLNSKKNGKKQLTPRDQDFVVIQPEIINPLQRIGFEKIDDIKINDIKNTLSKLENIKKRVKTPNKRYEELEKKIESNDKMKNLLDNLKNSGSTDNRSIFKKFYDILKEIRDYKIEMEEPIKKKVIKPKKVNANKYRQFNISKRGSLPNINEWYDAEETITQPFASEKLRPVIPSRLTPGYLALQAKLRKEKETKSKKGRPTGSKNKAKKVVKVVKKRGRPKGSKNKPKK